MKLSTKTRYGTRLILDLARHHGQMPISIGDISKRQDISVKYLEQIIRPLKKANLVVSTRGPKGGHSLAKSPKEITLGDIEAQPVEDHELLGATPVDLPYVSHVDHGHRHRSCVAPSLHLRDGPSPVLLVGCSTP